MAEVAFEFIFLATSDADAQRAERRVREAGFNARVARGNGEGTAWQLRIVVEQTIERSTGESEARFEGRIDDEYEKTEEGVLRLVRGIRLTREAGGIITYDD